MPSCGWWGMPDDLGDELRKDYKKFRRLQQVGDGQGMSLSVKLEYAFWAGAVVSVGAMLISMYFIDPADHGMVWLFGSLGGIIACSGLAFVVRQLPEVE